MTSQDTHSGSDAEFFDPVEHSHRRYNPLAGEWVLVSPHRSKRPWQGHTEPPVTGPRTRYDETCYLCPGNRRIGGEHNPDYRSTYVFTNDFAALEDVERVQPEAEEFLLKSQPVRGTCRVVCFSPDHSRTLSLMSPVELVAVIDCWQEQLIDLSQRYRWVQIFENKGAMMGCSNPHPHGQIWALDQLPTEAAKADGNLRRYQNEHGSNLLLDYARLEIRRQERVVDQNDHWLAVVPWWAVWPFETLLLPLQPVSHLHELSTEQRDGLAHLMKNVLCRYDNLFQCSFPYSMGWHGQPFNSGRVEHWQLHGHIYPPLLRSADVKKHMVGYEMLAEAQRDITPEQAAARLRACSTQHYLEA